MKYDASKRSHERASRVIPGGVNSQVRSAMKPFPLTFTHAKDAHIWDVDGNEYIDYMMGQGPMILGHTPAPVIEAIRKQLDKGLVYAGQTEDEIVAAELMCEHIPCAEKVRFSTTGSEAVHSAIRLARAVTNRKIILRFEGHYHGWLDTIAWNSVVPGVDFGPKESPPLRPTSRGQLIDDSANVLVRPWNDLDTLTRTFAEFGDAIAGVICDPFASAAGLIPGTPEFIQGVRDLCTKNGVVLIFDEVITGFRVHPAGAQAQYGVTPDLAIFAKALGAGIPVAAVAGRADLMDEFANGVVHSGTYNANPVAMAATRVALETIFANDGAALGHAHAQGEKLCEGLRRTAKDNDVPLNIRGVPTVFSTSFHSPSLEVRDARTAVQCDTSMLSKFAAALQKSGILITHFGIWFLSTAHTNDDIDRTLEAADTFLQMVK